MRCNAISHIRNFAGFLRQYSLIFTTTRLLRSQILDRIISCNFPRQSHADGLFISCLELFRIWSVATFITLARTCWKYRHIYQLALTPSASERKTVITFYRPWHKLSQHPLQKIAQTCSLTARSFVRLLYWLVFGESAQFNKGM